VTGRLRDFQIEFLSLGDVDVKQALESGRSPLSGDWAVENVRIRECDYRRLIFLSSQNLVQSEARLIVKSEHGNYRNLMFQRIRRRRARRRWIWIISVASITRRC
jgi:hypothetical protein